MKTKILRLGAIVVALLVLASAAFLFSANLRSGGPVERAADKSVREENAALPVVTNEDSPPPRPAHQTATGASSPANSTVVATATAPPQTNIAPVTSAVTLAPSNAFPAPVAPAPLAPMMPGRKFDARFVQPASSLPPPINDAQRSEIVTALRAKSDAEKAAAIAWAKASGFPIKGKKRDGGDFEIQAVHDGTPEYYETDNVNAAISEGVYPFLRPGIYNLRGAGWVAGVWDAGPPRSTHREFYDGSSYKAVFVDLGAGPHYDNIEFASHSTHVTGTICARGVDPSALGMAPDASTRNYDWNGASAEIVSEGASYGGEANKIYVSNHSYGTVCGWVNLDTANAETGATGWHWFGTGGESEDRQFGSYPSREGDQVACMTPYHLQFRSAGNNRGISPFVFETIHYRNASGQWVSGTWGFDSNAPGANGGSSGYDTLQSSATAKNYMVVGNLKDAVSNGQRQPYVDLSPSSSLGPCDDGRIKPDIVANGEDLYSCDSDSDTNYSYKTGTSMSSPAATGAGLLLHQLYTLLTGQYMRASTLKALMIHTATDIDAAGPDYKTGWGLISAGDAQTQVQLHAENPEGHHMVEATVQDTVPEYRLAFKAPANTVVTATLCWTDPAGNIKTGLDNTTHDLINDLDLRVVDANGTVHRAPQLSASSPSNVATYNGNNIDNVEKIQAVANAAGFGEIVVSYKGTLQAPTNTSGQLITTNTAQVFSLIVSGNTSVDTGTLAEGIDQPSDRRFNVSADRAWAFEHDANSYDADRVVSIPAGNNSNVGFDTAINGVQGVTFQWGVSSELNFDKLRFLVDGALISEISGEVATTTFAYTTTTTGNHVLRWEYVKDASLNAGQDRGWVDKLEFNNLAEAVDDLAHGYSMVAGSNVPWTLSSPGANDFAQCLGLGINQFSSFETTIQGPAVVAFELGRAGNYGLLYCTYGPNLGHRVDSVLRNGTREYFQIELDAGPQLVRFTFEKNNPGAGPSDGNGYVDHVVVLEAPATLSNALNLGASDYVPQTSGRGAWVARSTVGAPIDVNRNETIAVETALTTSGQPLYLTQSYIGPGLFSYWWRASGSGGSMSVAKRSTSDGTPLESIPYSNTDIAAIPGGTGWQQEFIELPTGVSDVLFTYTPSTNGTGSLDRFGFVANGQHPSRGLDRWTSDWEMLGDAPWFGVFDTTNGGLDSLTHNAITDNQSVSLTSAITGPKSLVFSWKVSSEAGYDFLRLLLDGVDAVTPISGEQPWKLVQLNIPAGPHTLRWVYQKDFSVSAGSDRAWLDGVAFLRPDWGISFAKPASSTLAAVGIRKEASGGFTLETSTNLVTWTQVPQNTLLADYTAIVPATGAKNFFRLRFAPEQRQTIDNMGFELPVVPQNTLASNFQGWGPDNDTTFATSVENIPNFAYSGTQHLSIDHGYLVYSKIGTNLLPGRHSLSVAIGNRPGFIDAQNRSAIALTDGQGNHYVNGNTNGSTFSPSGQFRLSYPISIYFDASYAQSLPVFIELSSPGVSRSFFDEVILVSEPQ